MTSTSRQTISGKIFTPTGCGFQLVGVILCYCSFAFALGVFEAVVGEVAAVIIIIIIGVTIGCFYHRID